MQLGSTASILLSDLMGLFRHFCNKLEDTSVPSDTQIKALLNQAQKEVQTFIITSSLDDWKENATDGTGTGSISLVDGTNLYAFPTDLLTFDRAEINYTGDTNAAVLARVVKMQEIDGALVNTNNDNAIYGSKANPVIMIRDGYLRIDPIPDANVSAGLKIYCQILVTDLSGSTDEPVFAKPFHDVIALNAAKRWLLPRGPKELKNDIEKEYLMRRDEMINFYASRNQSDSINLAPKRRSMN